MLYLMSRDHEEAVAQIAHEVHTASIDRVLGVFTKSEHNLPDVDIVRNAFKFEELLALCRNKPKDRRDPIEKKEGDEYSSDGLTTATVWPSGDAKIIQRKTIEFPDHNVTLDTTYTFLYDSDPQNNAKFTYRYQRDTLNEGRNAIDLSLVDVYKPTERIIDNKHNLVSVIDHGRMTKPKPIS